MEERAMKWMQFFTPVASLNWQEAQALVQRSPAGEVTLLDVRQPKEYERGHLPGAKLIPLGDLEGRLGELDRDKPIVIY
jgi:sulfur-carrier protein adenylyltransferase/sulfurtransferase